MAGGRCRARWRVAESRVFSRCGEARCAARGSALALVRSRLPSVVSWLLAAPSAHSMMATPFGSGVPPPPLPMAAGPRRQHSSRSSVSSMGPWVLHLHLPSHSVPEHLLAIIMILTGLPLDSRASASSTFTPPPRHSVRAMRLPNCRTAAWSCLLMVSSPTVK